jgi:hypothetical protein
MKDSVKWELMHRGVRGGLILLAWGLKGLDSVDLLYKIQSGL